MLVCLAGLSLAFLLAGQPLDLAVAALFADDTGFPLQHERWLYVVRDLNRWFLVGTMLACLASLLAKLARPAMGMLVTPRSIIFLVATLAVGPGLVANTLLKDNWGRPRPREIQTFGGTQPYVPAWVISDRCQRNCSFVSGEGAAGAWSAAPALLATPAQRTPALLASALWSSVTGLTRMAMGGHFLSDTLIGANLMLLIIGAFRAALWRLLPDRWNAAAEARLGEWGLRLRGRLARR